MDECMGECVGVPSESMAGECLDVAGSCNLPWFTELNVPNRAW